MEEHVVRLVVLVGVAVDALTNLLIADRHIVINLFHLEVGEVALVDAQSLVCHVGRLDGTIGDVLVDGVFCHIEVEGLVAFPSAADLGKHLHLDFLTLGRIQHLLPLCLVNQNLLFLAVDIFSAREGESCSHLTLAFLHDKVHWTDVGRNGHLRVVGVNLWKTRFHLGVGWHGEVLSACCQQRGDCCY